MAEVPVKSSENNDKPSAKDSFKCCKCKEELTVDKQPKLLHCLHSFCASCLENFSKSRNEPNKETNEEEGKSSDAEVTSTGDTKLRCPECNTEYTESGVVLNPFIQQNKKSEIQSEDGSPTEEDKFPPCTSCEDNQKATSFCMDCQEWLCDPCVVAHRRVKLTKDHTVSNKVKPNEVKEVLADQKQKQMFCQTHKTEELKLFCLTCDTLTCRDCQLNEHKDHKYQFIEETIEEQRKLLQSGLAELKKRLETNQEMAEKIIEKEKDIKKQQVDVFNEVRQVADMITNELISWCKQLLNFLQGVCHGRIKDLTYKKKEVETFAKKAKHTIEFVETALQSGDDLSVLHTKSFMTKSIATLSEQTINFQSTLLDLNIKYEHDAKFLTKNVSKMGFINVNGKSYPQQAAAEPPKQNPLSNLNKDNFSQNIADLLNQQPPHTREQYKNLPMDQKKAFLTQLMVRQRQQARGIMQHQQQQSPHVAAAANRMSQYSTDSGAIQDLYGSQNQRHPQQIHGVRTTRTFYPANRYQNTPQANRHPLQPQQYRPGPTTNFQQWRGGHYESSPIVSSTQRFQEPHYTALENLVQFSRTVQGNQGPTSTTAPLNQPRPPGAGPNLIPASQLPSGKFDIDPLNLRGGSAEPVRVKQEPRDRDYNPSCQFSSKQPPNTTPTPPAADSNPRLQSPSTSTNHQSPAHTPSPSHSDGGPGNPPLPSISPAMPDIGIIDSDRNELLQGLVHPSGHKFNAYHLHPKHDPSDPSEDYCGVCHNGGDLLCCDKCPKVFHLQCHVPVISTNLSSRRGIKQKSYTFALLHPLAEAKCETWTCTMCIPDQELIITTPIPREFEVTSTGKRKAPNGLVDKEIKVCERILLELFCLEISTVFHEPVSKSVPNYYKIIQHPMDFGTIKCKLRRGHFAHYDTIEQFISDVKLVFKNCFKYNLDTSDVYAVGKNVEGFFESLVRHFLPCYIDYFNRRTPSPAELLETNGGDGPSKNKKRRSPAPDSTRETNSPLHIH